MYFFQELISRNAPLFYFGLVCLACSFICIILIQVTQIEVLGINAWIKPFKFFLSTVIFCWTMAWYLGYLPDSKSISIYTWVVIGVLAFELVYISLKAGLGELSHFNVSTPGNATMFSLMGIAISLMTLFTLYIGLLFFIEPLPNLPKAYLWGIRLGIILFVIFAFEGGIMGAKLAHTVGAPDGGEGMKLLNWSLKNGDLRISHFIGMHALQVLPLVGFYILSSSWQMVLFAAVYFVITVSTLIQALSGTPLFKG